MKWLSAYDEIFISRVYLVLVHLKPLSLPYYLYIYIFYTKMHHGIILLERKSMGRSDLTLKNRCMSLDFDSILFCLGNIVGNMTLMQLGCGTKMQVWDRNNELFKVNNS